MDNTVIPEKTKRGFDERKAEFVEYLLLQGVGVKKACEQAKMSYATYHGWTQKHPDRLDEIRREVQKAGDIQWIVLQARRTMLATLEDPEASAHTRMSAAQFLIKNADPQIGEKAKRDDEQTSQIEIDLNSMSKEELERELKELEEESD